ncbi:MAG: hypothetical protein JRH06_05750 [Deltaproteobacteria bacterium]|nr:hypothetical protein [Deltaproteobacteria bacterium]MBW2137040.1 hypothetical protein [Deltaproteobacteria bacterium]
MTGFSRSALEYIRRVVALQCFPLAGLLVGLFSPLLLAGPCRPYIMPVEQIVGLMGKNFETFKSFRIVQLTQQDYSTNEEALWLFKEELILKSPGLYHSRVMDKGITRGHLPDSSYREFLLANDTERLVTLLSRMGINTEAVALTRFKGSIAYRIGEKDRGEPKLLVEKDRFLPLQISYRPPGSPPDHVLEVTFQDYRQVGKGWVPFQITIDPSTGPVETCVIQDIEINIPGVDLLLSPATSETVKGTEGGAAPRGQDEERLRNVIRSFEERYR